MSIKKFNNGNVHLTIKEDVRSGYYQVGNGYKNDMKELEKFIHNEMYINDLYINQINGYLYIIDYNTSLAYNLPCGQIDLFLERLGKGEKFILESLGKRISKSLLQDLENEY